MTAITRSRTTKYGALFVLAFLIPLIVPSVCVVVSGISMVPTLDGGDWLLINPHPVTRLRSFFRSDRIYNPKRGEIVVFRYPNDRSDLVVKRVIGVAGDHLRIVEGKLYRNGSYVKEPYAFYAPPVPGESSPVIHTFPDAVVPAMGRHAIEMLHNNVASGEIVVPSGNAFLLGDNRDASIDSRNWGFIAYSRINGTVLRVLWSFDPNACSDPYDSKGGCALRSFRFSRTLMSLESRHE